MENKFPVYLPWKLKIQYNKQNEKSNYRNRCRFYHLNSLQG